MKDLTALPLLSATRPQLKNIITLVNYLISLRGTTLADSYDHEYEYSCSFGYAIKSGKIKALKKYFRTNSNPQSPGNTYSALTDIRNSEAAKIVFGKDYYDYIVYGPFDEDNPSLNAYDHISEYDGGQSQMNAVIASLIHAYSLIERDGVVTDSGFAIKAVDTTKERITARITKLEAFVAYANTFAGDDTIDLSANVKAAQTDIAALKRALSI